MSDYGEHCERLAGYGVGDGELRDYEYPEPESDNENNETSDILSDIIKAHTGFDLYPIIEEQEQYWKDRDNNLDKIESACQFFDEKDKRDPFS